MTEKRIIEIANATLIEALNNPRSTKKTRTLHGGLSEIIQESQPNIIAYSQSNTNGSEKTVAGSVYQKKIDIALIERESVKHCIGVKFPISNYGQNANNLIESLMGETANIQSAGTPYSHIFLHIANPPYFQKDGSVSRFETAGDKAIKKYKNLFARMGEHVPKSMLICCFKLSDELEKCHSRKEMINKIPHVDSPLTFYGEREVINNKLFINEPSKFLVNLGHEQE